MAGDCIAKMAHSCGSSDGLQLFEDDGDVTGFCFACSTYVHDPLGGKKLSEVPIKKKFKKTPEQIAEEIEEINACSARKMRKIPPKYWEEYGVKVGVSQQDGTTPQFMYFPYYKGSKFVRYKVKLLEPKKTWQVGASGAVDLFGLQQAIESGSSRLYITEGEPDAVALNAVFQRYTKEGYTPPAVVSVPNGAGNALRDIKANYKKLDRHFKQIFLVFDTDDAGKAAQDDVCKAFPEFKVVVLPMKDPCEMVMAGKSKELFNAAQWNPEKAKKTRLINGRDVHHQARQKAEWGLSFPWKGLTDATRGMRFGETIYIAAGEKMG